MSGHRPNLSNIMSILTVIADVCRGGGEVMTTNVGMSGQGDGVVSFSQFYADVLYG